MGLNKNAGRYLNDQPFSMVGGLLPRVIKGWRGKETCKDQEAPFRGPCGANYRTRTCDLLITNQLLYQLS